MQKLVARVLDQSREPRDSNSLKARGDRESADENALFYVSFASGPEAFSAH